MNENLEWFLNELGLLNCKTIVRTNLVILQEDNYSKFIDIFAANKVELVASLPDYRESRTDKQRGFSTFKKCICVMKKLNSKGYSRSGSGLYLNLVHNPVGAYLPGNQNEIEKQYKLHLKKEYSVDFNTLYCITNMPINRFKKQLIASDNYDDYISALVSAFNPYAVNNVMCKNTISIGWDGLIYDCDFNQMLNLPIHINVPQHIDNFDLNLLSNREIIIDDHCFACTAGSGSSCQGSLE